MKAGAFITRAACFNTKIHERLGLVYTCIMAYGERVWYQGVACRLPEEDAS